ncbi:MAG: DUF262 domain-containing protein [Cellulomonas sp.]|nr:DUF262 domain-containing protein [Cellulomonas sp.]
MSIGELTSMYQSGELVVHPEFQRFFRWDANQKSRLIESILLGIPLPPIFVSTSGGGEWELVDGLQRVSTLLQLQGLLKDQEGKLVAPLEMSMTEDDLLPALDGLTWESGERALSEAQRRDIKRSRLDVQIIERDSSSQAKYDLFQRLNSYGSQLTTQELRSCLLVSVSPEFFRWVEELASHPAFQNTVQLPEQKEMQQYQLELVLRFLVLHTIDRLAQSELKGFASFLDRRAVKLAQEFPANKDALEDTFKRTFDLIDAQAGENSFRKWNPTLGRFTGAFLNTSFEVIALGLGYLIANGLSHRDDILEAIKSFWVGLPANFATGLSTEVRLTRYVPVGRQLMAAGGVHAEGV